MESEKYTRGGRRNTDFFQGKYWGTDKKAAEKWSIAQGYTTGKVKISGDGTNIGKRLQLENVTYTILTEKDVAMNEKGKYFLAMIKTTENYDNLKESLADLNKKMSNLK